MLRYAILFLIVALVAGYLGFGRLEGLSADIAKVCVGIFLILFVVSFFFGRGRGGKDLP